MIATKVLISSNFKYCKNIILKIAIGCLVLFTAITFSPNEVQAQDGKSRYEKIQKRKNKANRRLKRRGDRAKKARRSYTKFKIRNRQGDKAYKGDIAGRKVRSRISPSRRSRAVHPQPNPYAGRKRRSEASRAKAFNRTIRYSKKPRERAWKGDISGSKIRNKGFRSERSRLKPQTRPSSKRKIGERDGARFSGQGFKGIRSISGRSRGSTKDRRITPRSASGAYRVRKREKPYAIRERSKWESAFQGDITGRKFQSKRTTGRPGIKPPPTVKYSSQGKGRRGDRAYKGRITGGYKSITSSKEKAWNKDISGHKLRIRTSGQPKFNDPHFNIYPKRKRKGDTPYKGKLSGGGYKTAGRKIERTSKAIPVTPPGPGAERAIRFQGNIKASKPQKGGGSISRQRWNNKGKPIQGRGLRDQDSRVAKFQGNIKGGKPLKGGGSVSRDQWNNKGQAIQGRGYKDQDQRIAKFQGNLKGGKPLKGGGSVSRDQWNNKGQAIQGRGYRDQDQRIAKFQGNIKGSKPLKGGGSIARNQWNNKGRPLERKSPSSQTLRAMRFEGSFKVKAKSDITKQDRETANFTGNIKQWKYKTGPLDEMKYEGRFKRNFKPLKNPKAVKGSLKSRGPGSNDKRAANFTGNIKQWKYKTGPLDEMKYEGRFKRTAKYKRNPNASKEALVARQPKANKGGRYEGRVKVTSNYKRNPNASKEALPGKAPLAATNKAMKFQGRFKATVNYKKKPNAAAGSLKGIGPSKAAISASNYQGNLKMRKGRLGDKHPSFKFDQPKNTTVEKTKFGIRLLWSKLFKKNENQPAHLKQKERKPRYDKGEQDLWND